MTNEVHKYKHKINNLLGEKSSDYWSFIKKWLTCALSNEELDAECRRLFPTPDDAVLHTNFMISLKNRLNVPVNHGKTHEKRTSRKPSEKLPIFEPANVSDYAPVRENNPKPILYPDGSMHVQKYASEELFLPEKHMILGRLLITAWENEIEEVNDNVADMLVQATQFLLKNVLTAVLTSNHSYKTYNTVFKYAVGADVPDVFIQNANEALIQAPQHNKEPSLIKMNPNVDKEDQLSMLTSSCNKTMMKKKRVTVQQLYDVLKFNRNLIPDHSVYALTVEQIAFELDDNEILYSNPVTNKNNQKMFKN